IVPMLACSQIAETDLGSFLCFQPITAAPQRDPIQPGAELFRLIECGEGAVSPKKRLLGQIFSGAAMPGLAVAERHDPRSPTPHQLRIGVGTSAQSLTHQLGIRHPRSLRSFPFPSRPSPRSSNRLQVTRIDLNNLVERRSRSNTRFSKFPRILPLGS